MDDITFFILRHVNSKLTNNYWKKCYLSIRKFYKNKIIIIDDNSKKKFIDNTLSLENTETIDSEFKGAGELLPYYYFHKLKPSSKMIFLHDSMFLIKKFNENKVNSITDVSYLFYFSDHKWDDIESIKAKLTNLDYSAQLKKTQSEQKWVGCFGVSSIISLDFLNKLQEEFNLFSLLTHVKNRDDRKDIERIFAILCYHKLNKNNFFINCIHSMPQAFLVNYQNMKRFIPFWKQTSPVIKIWSGR